MDWTFDAIRRKTAEGNYEAVNYHRFADDIVIAVSGHSSKSGWAELALRRLREQLKPLGVKLNLEKTQMVNVLKGESFGFLGFDLRRIPSRNKNGFFVFMIPKKKARTTVKAKIRTLLTRRKRRRKRSIGWQRWSNEYLYGVLGLYWDWKVLPLKSAESFR